MRKDSQTQSKAGDSPVERGAEMAGGTFVKENVPDSEQDFDVNDGGEGGEEPV